MKVNTKYARWRMISIVMFLIITISCKKEAEKEEQIPKVTTNAVTSISGTTAICGGNVISCGGSTWVNRGICWGDIITNPTLDDYYKWADVGSQTGSFSVMLEWLTPGTTYHVRAYASNDTGIGYGSVISFTTTGSVTGDIVFNTELTYGSLSDTDGNVYKTVRIGSQTWMAENLKTTKYNDGTDIPLITLRWINLTTPGYCWYFNDETKFKNIFGALYNWNTIKTGKLCPTGWHVPSNAEWTTLTNYLGGDVEAGQQLKESGTTHWITPNTGASNSSGFTALPGGTRWGVETDPISYFTDLGHMGYFWSTSEYNDPSYGFAWSRALTYGDSRCDSLTFNKSQGLSVRCLQD